MIQLGEVGIYEDNRTCWAGFLEIYFVDLKAICNIQNRSMTKAVSYMSLKISDELKIYREIWKTLLVA